MAATVALSATKNGRKLRKVLPMECVRVRGENADFSPPQDWDSEKDGNCGQLPIRREVGKGGRVYLYSNWKPNTHELAILNAGGVVELLCVGVQPPVAIGVTEAVVIERPIKNRDLEADKTADKKAS
jgi:hypothetical protein